MVSLFKITLKFPYGGNPIGDYYITAKTKESATNYWNSFHPEFKLNYSAFKLVKKNVKFIEGIKYVSNNGSK